MNNYLNGDSSTDDILFGNNTEQLIFPMNIHDTVTTSGGLKKGEKNGLIISFWFFINAIAMWFLAGWLRNVIPQYYLWAVLGIELLIQATIGSIVLRIVMDEKTMISEMSGNNTSFARYFSIYHEILAQEGSTYPFDIMEFSDGSYGVYLQLLLGYNTNQISNTTYDINVEIQKLINKAGMAHKIIYTTENFGNSAAAEDLRQVVAGIEDPNLFTAYREIVQGILTTANEESNVVCATYIIYARSRIQKEELTRLITNIFNVVQAENTVYREAVVLPYQEIVEFYRNYYKLDVLDMGLIRVHAAQRKGVSCPVSVLKVYGQSGKTYITPAYSKLQKGILAEHGLDVVNGKEI